MDNRDSAILRRQQGHLNATEMATQLGVNRHTFQYWITRGFVPMPTITFTGRRRYYTSCDIDVIREILEEKND
jgi:DNA-binding transcriptional MerR regulator